jgi:hypothetical protein
VHARRSCCGAQANKGDAAAKVAQGGDIREVVVVVKLARILDG